MLHINSLHIDQSEFSLLKVYSMQKADFLCMSINSDINNIV